MKNYGLPIKYLMVMTILLVSSGMWLFILHTSVSVEGTADYYAPKSFFGMIETITPHLLGMGVLIFVLTHFFAIIQGIEHKRYIFFSISFFVIMLIMNLSGLFITQDSFWFALVKLVTTLLFVGYTIVSMWKLLRIL